jgi:CheY-like chemotaxis protein
VFVQRWNLYSDLTVGVAPIRRTVAALGEALSGNQLQNVTVLVAEEDPLLADDLLKILSEEGATIAGPVSGIDSALELLEHQQPDCAVVNAGIAYETAMRLSRRLKQLGIPYLIQSGHSELKLPEELKGSRFLAKPIERQRLIESVVAMLSDKQ